MAKVAGLLACFAAMRLSESKGRAALHRNLPLLGTLAALQTVGLAMSFASAAGWNPPLPAALVRAALLESSFFLLAAYASFYARTNAETAIVSFVASTVVAGFVQTGAVFLPFPAAAALVASLAPLSVVLLHFANRHAAAHEAPSPPPGSGRAAATGKAARAASAAGKKTRVPADGLCATIALLSFVVAPIYLSWLGLQEGQAASAAARACAGVGAVLAGYVLITARRAFGDRKIVELARFVVPLVAIGTLYMGSLLDGLVVVLPVIPLNAVHVAVLLLAWLAPFSCAEGRRPMAASCNALLAQRLGMLAGTDFVRILAVDGLSWLSGALTALATAALVFLGMAQLSGMKRKGRPETARTPARPDGGSEEDRDLACARVAERICLTPREREVFELLVRGRTAGYIAKELVISDTTAKTHIKHIYQKAGVQSKQVLLDLVESESRPSAT